MGKALAAEICLTGETSGNLINHGDDERRRCADDAGV